MAALPVLIARLGDRAAAIGFVKAALKRAVAIVPLDAPPTGEGDHLLLLHAPGLDEPVLLAAVPVGEPTAGMYPLQLGPRDDYGEGSLLALLASQGALSIPPPPRAASVRPPPRGTSADLPRTREEPREITGTPSTRPRSAPPARLGAPSDPPPRVGAHSAPPGRARSIPPIPRDEPDPLDAERREMDAMAAELRALAQRGDAAELRALMTRLAGEARGAQPGLTTRASLAARALAAMDDASALGPIADVALGGVPAAREAARDALKAVGASGAAALCGARARSRAKEARPRFLATLRELGPLAAASVSLSLEATLDSPGADTQLVEDLLRAMPYATAPGAAAVAARFLSHTESSVRTAAVVAVAAADGPRARNALAGALSDASDQVRITALATLRRIDAIDAEVVAMVGRILSGEVPAGDELRATAAAALADASHRGAAIAILMRAIEPPKTGMLASLVNLVVKADEDAHVLETMARVLLSLTGPEGRQAVERRAAESQGKVRARLMAVLAG